MPTSCRRMFALKRSSTPKSRHSRRDAAVDRQNQNMELPITLPADHPLRLGNFTSAHLGTFESALTPGQAQKQSVPETKGGQPLPGAGGPPLPSVNGRPPVAGQPLPAPSQPTQAPAPGQPPKPS